MRHRPRTERTGQRPAEVDVKPNLRNPRSTIRAPVLGALPSALITVVVVNELVQGVRVLFGVGE